MGGRWKKMVPVRLQSWVGGGREGDTKKSGVKWSTGYWKQKDQIPFHWLAR